MTDHKPGTVAVATVRGVPNVTVMLTDSGNGWVSESRVDSGPSIARLGHIWHPNTRVTDVRPLVVLDLSDAAGTLATLRDAQSMMLRGQVNHHRLSDLIGDIEAQVKPAEPTGRWAVVEGRDGNRWVRDDNTAAHPWRHIGPVDRSANWGGVCVYAPITVHHDGVTA